MSGIPVSDDCKTTKKIDQIDDESYLVLIHILCPEQYRVPRDTAHVDQSPEIATFVGSVEYFHCNLHSCNEVSHQRHWD